MALVHIALTQLSMKSGFCKYKRKGCAAVTKEFLHLHTRESFGPLKAEDMTEEMFIKEKRDGTIKVRVCTDGHKQREKYNNSETTSPTVST